jgi:hypothetical protein
MQNKARPRTQGARFIIDAELLKKWRLVITSDT